MAETDELNKQERLSQDNQIALPQQYKQHQQKGHFCHCGC